MANNPVAKGTGAPVSGTSMAPVNASFTGPNANGLLNDLPPIFGGGPTPNQAINGVTTNKLGIQGGESPKTHG